MTHGTTDMLEPFRKYLTVLAGLHLDQKLRGKLDPSDVVQQTMLRAYSALGELRPREPEVLAAWLGDPGEHAGRRRQALRAGQARCQAGAVASRRPRPLGLGLRRLAGRRSDVAQRTGGAERGAAAVGRSPGGSARTMREVVVLKHCQGWTLQQIADRIGRSVPAVASLLRRGLEELRNRLQTPG